MCVIKMNYNTYANEIIIIRQRFPEFHLYDKNAYTNNIDNLQSILYETAVVLWFD